MVFTEEQVMLRYTVGRFGREQVAPLAAELEKRY